MSRRQRHFALLFVFAIATCSSHLSYAIHTARIGTVENTDDVTSTIPTKSIDANDEERTPVTKVTSDVLGDSKMTASLMKQKPALTKPAVEAATAFMPTASLGKSISKSQLISEAVEVSHSLTKSKELEKEIPHAVELIQKNPSLVKAVASTPSVREAKAILNTNPSIQAKRNVVFRVAKAVMENREMVLTIMGSLVVIGFIITLACLIFAER